MMPNDPVVGGVALRRPAIQSPDYVAGISGWTINQDGTVEFNSGVFRGTVTAGVFKGSNFFINSAGFFMYSGTPAANLLIQSESNTQGQDDFGNYFLSGNTTYIPTVGGYIAVQNAAGGINYWFATTMVSVSNPWVGLGSVIAFNGTPNFLQIAAPPNVSDYIALAGAVKVTGGFHYSGPIVAYAPSTTTDETWHTLGALAAGSGYTVNEGRYRITAEGETEIDINLVAGAATVAGVYVFANALPAAYQPPITRSYPMGWNGGITAGMNFPSLRVTNVVNLQLPALPNTTVISCTQRIPVN